MVATSASVGDAMWEKRSISGVMAAIQTRVDGQVRLRVQRSSSARRRRAWELPLRRSFDVTLSKPLGLALAQRSAANATGEEEERWVEVEAVETGGSAEASGLHAANLSALVLPESSTNFGDMQPLPSWRQHIAQDSRVIYRERARGKDEGKPSTASASSTLPTARGKNSG